MKTIELWVYATFITGVLTQIIMLKRWLSRIYKFLFRRK